MGRKPKQLHPEDILQAAVVQHLELRGQPGLVYWHTPNSSKMGGKRTPNGIPLAALRLKKQGFRKGVSDLVFLHRGKFFALELKAGSNRPDDAQRAFIESVVAAGGQAAWANSLDAALALLERWGLIRWLRGCSSHEFLAQSEPAGTAG